MAYPVQWFGNRTLIAGNGGGDRHGVQRGGRLASRSLQGNVERPRGVGMGFGAQRRYETDGDFEPLRCARTVGSPGPMVSGAMDGRSMTHRGWGDWLTPLRPYAPAQSS